MKKVSNKIILISRGKQNNAIFCRPRTSFQGYFKVKVCFLNGNLYFSIHNLNLQKKLNNFHMNYLFYFIYTTSNKKNRPKTVNFGELLHDCYTTAIEAQIHLKDANGVSLSKRTDKRKLIEEHFHFKKPIC